jgi:iron complex outermembrane recepter protein
VVSHTAELGARGTLGKAWRWSAAAYQTRLTNDIEFISASAGAGNAGYFANVAQTRRQGFELSADGKLQALTLSLRYSFTDATFLSAFLQSSPANSSADQEGAIQVEPGDRIPGIPRNVFKARIAYDITPRVNVGMNLVVSDGVYARGDENNQDVNGKLPSYALLNLDAHYRPIPNLEIFARVNNVFDRNYYDFGILGQNFFTGPNHTFGPAAGLDPVSEQFRGPGAPIGAWIGVRYSLGGTPAGRADED